MKLFAPLRATSLLWLLALPLAAQNNDGQSAGAEFQQTAQQIEQRLENALEELSEVRDEIAKEKGPLGSKINQLQARVIELQNQRDELRTGSGATTTNLQRLQNEIQKLEENADFANDQLVQFASEFKSRIDISENQQFDPLIEAALTAGDNEDMPVDEQRRVQLDLVEAAIERLNNIIGGMTYEGEALAPNDEVVQGTFINAGPQVFFTTPEGSVAGLVQSQPGSELPTIAVLPPENTEGLPDIAETGSGKLPLDPTLGRALKAEQASKSLGQYVEDGGEIGLVIIGLGILALAMTAFKVYEIVSFKTPSSDDVDAVLDSLQNGDKQAALNKADAVGGTGGELLKDGVEHFNEKRHLIEEVLFERILRARPYLERFLPFISITSAASPLLGLLGTVVGMIKTFQLITVFGTGDAKSLSSGISEALVTTALGLIVAIPTLILHGVLSRMAKRKVGLLEQGTVAFVNGAMAQRHSAGGDSAEQKKSGEEEAAG